MINKLVVIINSLKVPKINKMLPYEMKFLVQNYSCLQNPWLGGNRPQIPILSVLKWICWTPPPNKIPGYATEMHYSTMFICHKIYVYLQILRNMCLGGITPFASTNLSKRLQFQSLLADQFVKVRVPLTKTGYREGHEYAVKVMK